MWWWTLALAAEPMALQVVDASTGQGIPCATLTTVHQVELVTDDEGLAAFLEPGLVGQPVWFEPAAPGYRYPADFLGLVGTAVDIEAGGFARIELERSGPGGPCPASDHAQRLIEAGVPDQPMRIEVVDAATGRGVPLVEVVAGDRRWLTDSAGNIAVVDPALYGVELELVASQWHGYGPSAPVAATVGEGGHAVLQVDRHTPAERLYRITGPDPFRDSELLGLPTPFPALRGQVAGIDSCLEVMHDGAPLWLFGDTLRPSYPLGHFDTAAAVPSGDIEEGIQLDFLVDDEGFSRGVADLSDDGPVWVTIPTTVDDGGDDVVLALYGVYDGLEAVERGFAVLAPGSTRFRRVGPFPLDTEISHHTPIRTAGHVFLREGLRFPDALSAAIDLTTWQTWSPIDEGAIDRYADGTARWAWRDGLSEIDVEQLAPADRWTRTPREPDTGVAIDLHYGDVSYSPHLRRYVHVVTREGGDSAFLGELWLTVADTPFGPWSHGRRVAAFDHYTVYNPMVHAAFDTHGPRIHFQATYTDFFSGAETKTPRYDYNQLMFGLDLDEPRARLPVAFYLDAAVSQPTAGPDLPPEASDPVVQFHAYEGPHDGMVSVGRDVAACAGGGWTTDAADPLLWASATPSLGLVPLWDDGGTLVVGAEMPDDSALAWVFPVEGASHVPAGDFLPPVGLDAGPDRCGSEGEPVELLAQAEGGEVQWSWEGGGAAGVEAVVELPAGDHVVTATLTTPEGQVLEDRVLVHLEPAEDPTDSPDPTEPTTSVPGGSPRSPTVGASDGGCGCDASTARGGLLDALGRRRGRL